MHSPYQPNQSHSSTPKYLGVFILMVFVFMLGLNIGMSQSSNNGNRVIQTITGNRDRSIDQSEVVDMDLFWEAWNVVSSNYVDPNKLDAKKMIHGAISGMVFSLDDPYTAFLTPKESKDFQNSLSGNFFGIGAELTFRNERLTIVSPLKDSPAKEAGIQPEDVIIAINDELTDGMSLEEAAIKIRGEKGTEVILTLAREGVGDFFDVTIERDQIHVNSVEWEMIDSVAWIELNTFGDATEREFSKAVSDILSESPEGIILDLRFNGGGLLEGAVDIASEFLNNEEIVSIKERNPENDEIYYANSQGRMPHLPMVVLINRGSASASEILAGALQDYKRATIIGETSFGKGTVQSIENFDDGSSLRITTARWYRPNDQNVEGVGVEPDFNVERTDEDFEADIDPPLEAAIEYLKTGSVPDDLISDENDESQSNLEN